MGEKIMELKQISDDVRGKIWVFNWNGKDYLLIFTKTGYLRGGEIHEGKQYNILLEGEMTWFTKGTYSRKLCVAPEYIETPKGYPHMMEALTDCLMLEWREKPVEQPMKYYKPFRKIIEAKMDAI